MFTGLGHDSDEETLNEDDIFRIDEATGFARFPEPGDVEKRLLPVLIDIEEAKVAAPWDDEPGVRDDKAEHKQFWMPDKLCKTCYHCEEIFTVYKRKHHCRMCGQIFCNQCSSYYVDVSALATSEWVSKHGNSNNTRCCRMCYDQLMGQLEQKKALSKGAFKSGGDMDGEEDGGDGDGSGDFMRDQMENSQVVIKGLQRAAMSHHAQAALSSEILYLEGSTANFAGGADGATQTPMCRGFFSPPVTVAQRAAQLDALMAKASQHLEAVVNTLTERSTILTSQNKPVWKSKYIVHCSKLKLM